MKKQLLAGVVLLLMLSSCSKFARIQKSTNYDYKYAKANEYFDKKKYTLAYQLYEELFPFYRGSRNFEDLYYRYAYCYYNMKDYLNAENLFKEFLGVFPNSNRREELEYMRAYCYHMMSPKVELDQTHTAKTMGLMQTFITNNPGSARAKEASEIIDLCRLKMEEKDAKAAQLYFNIGQYLASAISFKSVMNTYPESVKSDEYKFMVVKAYYQYAINSVEEKKIARFEQVINEFNDFSDRFKDSRFYKEAEKLYNNAFNNIKKLQNEQDQTSAQR